MGAVSYRPGRPVVVDWLLQQHLRNPEAGPSIGLPPVKRPTLRRRGNDQLLPTAVLTCQYNENPVPPPPPHTPWALLQCSE